MFRSPSSFQDATMNLMDFVSMTADNAALKHVHTRVMDLAQLIKFVQSSSPLDQR